MQTIPPSTAIQALVRNAVRAFATGFQARHEAEVDDADGTLNMKIHNVFIAVLGPEIQYYTALVRSLDSSLGTMLEGLAIEIAKLSYDVQQHVEGTLTGDQTRGIAELLQRYTARTQRPAAADYAFLRTHPAAGEGVNKRHVSDYYLRDRRTGHHYLIELKIGGDLDNKKSRSEKEAILEQLAILSNTLPTEAPITIHFATAYNRYGEDQPWRQERVRQFFAEEELLIGRDFWNFICQSDQGYTWILDAYRESAPLITAALDSIKRTYLDEQRSSPEPHAEQSA